MKNGATNPDWLWGRLSKGLTAALIFSVCLVEARGDAISDLTAYYWSFHNLRDIYLFTMKVMFYILWYAPGWEDVTTQYIGGDALSCYRSAPSGERCRGDREAAGFTLGQCITLAHKMAAGWTEGS
jgi:hypothetical protein